MSALNHEMTTANPLWGAPRFTGSDSNLGIVSEPTLLNTSMESTSIITNVADISHQLCERDHGRRLFVWTEVTFRRSSSSSSWRTTPDRSSTWRSLNV